MCQKGIPFILILNPQVGNPPIPTPTQVIGMVNNQLAQFNNFIVGYIIKPNTQQNQIQNFMNALPGIPKAFIHEGQFNNPAFFQAINQNNVVYHIFKDNRVTQQYINDASLGTNKVLLSDGFNKLARNSDYNGTEFFSDLHINYPNLGYFGFGDYQCIGFSFSPGGGPANAVAIHLTYQNGNTIYVEHFVSDTIQGITNTGGKFLEALNHLITSLNVNPTRFINSTGVQDFRGHHQTQHFPQLGSVKRSSIKHHMELIASLI